MIEKIKSPLDLKVGNYKGTKFDIIPADTFAMVCRKINELVNAVNELQEFADVADKNLVKLMEDATREENVQDKFAEQRRWIGKLCWYKLCEGDTWKVGRLEKIQENADAGYPFVFDGLCYKICEPVKPDDDIIYKGE